MRPRHGALHCLQFFQHAAQLRRFECIGSIGLGLLGIIVDFHEYSIKAGCHCRKALLIVSRAQ